jgi:hypothetical protein
MRITSLDCELLARYHESKPWNDADAGDRDAIKDLRNRLKEIAAEAARRFPGTTKTTELASHPTPNGRTPKELWCCIYPKSVPNKSYGLQVAIIVSGAGIEICFCLGSGTGQINNLEVRTASERAMAQLKVGLKQLPPELSMDFGKVVSKDWTLRKRWKLGPGAPDFKNFDEWLGFAVTSEGGACISKYWSPAQLTNEVDIAEEFYSACRFFQPILDAAYSGVEFSTAESTPSFLQLMKNYADERVVFMSPKRDARYLVTNVASESFCVDRLDSTKSELVTLTSFATAVAWLESRGGQAGREELDNTVAKHMSYLQSVDMGLAADGKTAVLLDDPVKATQQFIQLVLGMQTATLYKPLILALVIEGIRDGELTHNRFEFDWLLPKFIGALKRHGHDGAGEQQLAEGFARMANDLFWLHAYREPVELLSFDRWTPAQIRRRISHARLHEAYWRALQNPDSQQQVLDALAERWWPEMSSQVSNIRLVASMEQLVEAIAARGFIFHPWQIATYVSALRTKPFVILAGISGTGKSKLPELVSSLTSGICTRVSVRPDWTDSSEVLGYVDLSDRFRPGRVLQLASDAQANPGQYHVCLIDEMNLARVEHYFAEVLSAIEDRRPDPHGGFQSTALLSQKLPAEYREWQDQVLPANLGIVGTVNMDESSHGFSRKVLDRAFTIELSEVDLSLDSTNSVAGSPPKVEWSTEFWSCKACRLSEIDLSTANNRVIAEKATGLLQEINQSLVHCQLQVGYRTRDEVILFLIHAEEISELFRTRGGESVDPIDLAIMMKILPRLVGGGNAIRQTLMGLIGVSVQGQPLDTEDETVSIVDAWVSSGRRDLIEGARLPRTAARLCLMWKRLEDGYTSYWL